MMKRERRNARSVDVLRVCPVARRVSVALHHDLTFDIGLRAAGNEPRARAPRCCGRSCVVTLTFRGRCHSLCSPSCAVCGHRHARVRCAAIGMRMHAHAHTCDS